MQIAPIGNLPTPDGEWTPDTSWATPAPTAGTLAELIHDLVEGLNASPPLEQLTQPTVDVASVEVSPVEVSPVEVSSEARSESTVSEIAIDPSVLEQLDQLLAEPPALITEFPERSNWFLGVDIGTTGISAVLLNQAQCQLYPVYWQPMDAEGSFAVKKKFRLPTAVSLRTNDSSASPLSTIRLEPATATAKLSLSDWKPYLNVALPHYSPQTSQWEPVLQWTEHQTVALRTLQEALQQLLITLNPERASFMPGLVSGALGLETAEFQAVLQNLAGVIVGYPSNWSDTYSFNVREAILQAGLVSRPDQIVFIEEAIATLLSALPAADGRPLTLAHQQATSQTQGHLHNANWQGMTLILTAGASLTELVLVNLPQQLHLNHTDFYVRSLPYAGQGIDQDILIQLLYPALLNLSQTATDAGAGTAYDVALEALDLNELRLADFSFPVAELDLVKRHQLQQHLTSSAQGHQLLTVARLLKITLQHQTRFTLKYGPRRLVVERQDFTSHVLLPYVQRLNRELNTLLAQTNTTAAAVNQVICTGGTASLGAIARWLRQKLPNATIIQDTYGRTGTDNCIPSCSRVAYGLATLPLHPQVLDLTRHQYSDYFLLLELLRALPQQPMRIETIMQILEGRGINTQACRFRILALLDGHLPPGLVPAEQDATLLTPESAANPDYQAIRLSTLFNKPADRTYEPNRHQWNYLQQYLATLLADTEQTLSQPLAQVPFLHPSPQ